MKKATLILALLLTSNCIIAQEVESKTTPTTTFAGSADAYYRDDFAKDPANNRTSFTNSSNSFELGMASIEASHKFGKASVFVDLGFGKRAAEFSYNDTSPNDNVTFLIKQLNFTYEFSEKFKLIFGSFATHLGYELVDAVDNKNYSMSYAFTNGPFFNTGLKAQYTTGKFSFMAGVTNPTDFKTAIDSGTDQKTYIGQISYTGDTGAVYLNFTSGSNNPSSETNATQFDIVATKKLSDKFALGFNGTYASLKADDNSSLDAKWFALVGYANYTFTDKLSLAYRIEYFDDKDAAKYALVDNTIFANTFSLNFKEGNFTFIPEIRFDNSSEDMFFKKNGNPTSTAGSVLFATTYSF
ncbi:outer membrane beta-barrel protein [Flavobacterium sp. TSSA_36]|uniref:outer membrane beta-barrel protein n=1 Tax=Flavobacterium sp. TSSA_36 TaxID=3447669 RepID=UPI003F329CE0